jgi:hypothetical protein
VSADAFVEALSLAEPVQARVAPGEVLLDSGTEPGLPAIPPAVALPDRRFVLTERSVEKAAFLWKVMGALGLAHVSLIHADTQEGVSWLQGASHDSLDGRSRRIRRYLSRCGAIDPMDSILDIVDILPEGGLFLCHSGEITWELGEKMFHVEQVEDAWTRSGDRLNRLYLLRYVGGGA